MSVKTDWLWDRKISPEQIKKIFSDPSHAQFVRLSAVLLSRKNSAQEVFADYLSRKDFFRAWQSIKKQMRKDQWNNPRIEYWQAIYETLKKDPQAKSWGKERTTGPISEFCRDIGTKIRMARMKTGLTQKELAAKLNISQQIISRVESGRQNISLETLKSIANCLGYSLGIDLR